MAGLKRGVVGLVLGRRRAVVNVTPQTPVSGTRCMPASDTAVEDVAVSPVLDRVLSLGQVDVVCLLAT